MKFPTPVVLVQVVQLKDPVVFSGLGGGTRGGDARLILHIHIGSFSQACLALETHPSTTPVYKQLMHRTVIVSDSQSPVLSVASSDLLRATHRDAPGTSVSVSAAAGCAENLRESASSVRCAEEKVELMASIRTEGETANAWWGKGVYSVPRAPDEWEARMWHRMGGGGVTMGDRLVDRTSMKQDYKGPGAFKRGILAGKKTHAFLAGMLGWLEGPG